ncbi:MAG: glutamate--tRNA ligase [Dehalococcoidales bacterium]|nr:glutamate--tRNA ligase [Dehalococcoidales bacterium]
MTEPVRVRFAPSPTGMPHAGNIHTAIFDYLLARHTGGTFILRVEDTDTERKVEGAVDHMMEALKWLGLDWDEGPDIGGPYAPYYQSERLPLYKAAAEKMIAQGNAYYCYCSQERLEQMRREQEARKQPPGYDRHCRNLTPEQRAEYEAQGIKPVVRFKTPDEGKMDFHDIIYGDVSFENRNIDDFVMLKSDGFPTYHLANIVDDHEMKITHVIRGEEWVSSTPRHLLMYQAMGYPPPQYVHMPVLVGKDRAKLSKRRGAIPILEYRDMGYLPEALFNFLVLIGWSLDDKTEIMTREQIIENFSLERMGKTAAAFNQEKLEWMNGVYIRNLCLEDFAERVTPFMEKELPHYTRYSHEYLKQSLALVQERAKTLAEVPDLVSFLFTDDIRYGAELFVDKKTTKEDAVKALEASLEKLKPLEPFTSETMEALLRPMAEILGMKTGQLFGALRTATTGRTAAPPLFQTMEVLGKDRCLRRIEEALGKLRG